LSKNDDYLFSMENIFIWLFFEEIKTRGREVIEQTTRPSFLGVCMREGQ
jgi:hypothetical protein